MLGEQPPPEVEQLLERRRALGQDLFDEVWEGVYHVAPAPTFGHGDVEEQLSGLLREAARRAGLRGTGPVNIGRPGDFRVPDRSYHRSRGGTWNPTAAVVVEVVSPGDESYEKLDFYARHDVDEVWVADPLLRVVRIWQLRGASRRPGPGTPAGDYAETGRSDLLGTDARRVAGQLDWPPPEA